MAPFDIETSSSWINLFSLKYWITPRPSHLEHAPYGLLKENILGSNSATAYPHCEQEKLDECSVETFSPISSISTNPLERYREVSIDSASLDLSSSEFLITKRSTTAEISCFLFLSNSGNSSIGYTTPFTLTLT